MKKQRKAFLGLGDDNYKEIDITADIVKKSYDSAFKYMRDAQAEGYHFLQVTLKPDGYRLSGNLTIPEMLALVEFLSEEVIKLALNDVFGLRRKGEADER